MAGINKPRPQSHLLHTGFLDLVDLVSHTTSKLRLEQSSSRLFANNGFVAAAGGTVPVGPDVESLPGAASGRQGADGMSSKRDVSGTQVETGNTTTPDPARTGDTGARGANEEQARRRVSRVPVPAISLPLPASAQVGLRPSAQAQRSKGSRQVGLKYRKVNKRDISYPTHFRHVLHASTYEEAAELLMRWSLEGLDNKIGDPAWAHPMKELVQARAKEQQALAVAQVVEATAWSKTVCRNSKQKLAPGQLHVVNGLPSSIYSTTNNTLRSAIPLLSSSLDRVNEDETSAHKNPPVQILGGPGSGYFSPRLPLQRQASKGEEPSIAELLAEAETPMLIANLALGSSGDGLSAQMQVTSQAGGAGRVGRWPANPFMPSASTSPPALAAGSAAFETDDGNSAHGAEETVIPGAASRLSSAEQTPPTAPAPIQAAVDTIRSSPQKAPFGPRAQLKRRISPIQIKKKALSPPPAESAEQAYMIKGSSRAEMGHEAEVTPASPSSPTFPPFRVIEPSLPTLERAMSIALYFEQYYHGLFKMSPVVSATDAERSGTGSTGAVEGVVQLSRSTGADASGNYLNGRARRLADLEAELASANPVIMSEQEKLERRRRWQREENRLLRERRRKVDVQAFEMGRVIGHGAFGVVRIAREKRSGDLVAIKQLRKADMLRKSQEGHIKAEKDVLAAAATRSFGHTSRDAQSWIVKLHYAFQDIDNLYLVLDYMGGGDLLNLLVALDTFSERMTRFYVAEMILSLAETHSLGYIHRDIKPDNFLFTPEGHIRVSDFGLATDLHWAHDTNHYQHQREALLQKHGADLEYPAPSGTVRKKMRKKDVERIMGKEWAEKGEGVLSWRERNRRSMAYSVCGTNSYMAPEVIRGQGYGFSCDWWSLGVIMYECLYGYPPFTSSSRHATRQKILNWKSNLKFPPSYQVSKHCVDFMTKLLCEPEDRLGSVGRPSSRSRSASFLGSSRRGTNGTTGLESDGVEEIKAHTWFASIDWDSLHLQPAPYNPALAAEDDTKHFDTDIPDEPLAAPNGVPADATRDPMLGHSKHGKELLEIRKDLAFRGWTFKSPTAGGDRRYGHMAYISSGGSSEEESPTAGADADTGRGDDDGYGAEGLRGVEEEFGRMGLLMPATGRGTVVIRGGTMRGRALSL